MKVLFVHQNCPGQFKYLAPKLASIEGNEVVFITRPGKPNPPNVRKLEYNPAREPAPSTHRYLKLMEEGILNGQAAAKVALEAKKKGFRPDIIVAHMGWGEALYLKNIWPGVPLLGYFEWFYRPFGSDVDFLDQPTLDDVCRIQSRNGLHLLNLELADWGISPTQWQLNQHPESYRNKISVIHDGVNTDLVKPNPEVTGTLKDDLKFKYGDEVITYVSRNLEPYRGFPSFMRAAEKVLKRRPNAHIIVVGGDGVSYGSRPKGGGNYREQMLAELDLDLNRIHFLGKVKYDVFLRILQLSAAHVYLTVPFVLSWSMLEAMSAGCLVIGSRTPPVEEIIKDGKNGLLVDFYSPEEIANRIDEALDHPDRMARIRRAARQTVLDRYALNDCLERQVRLINDVARGVKQMESVASIPLPNLSKAVKAGATQRHSSTARKSRKTKA